MARTFENPVNGYRNEVGVIDSVAVFFFGGLYLAVKGLWRHVFIWLVLVAPLTVATGGPGIVLFMPLASLIYAFLIQGILAKDYLSKGWREVGNSAEQESSTKVSAPPRPAPRQETETRKCPFCAEEVKTEAIKCKHCQSELPPVPKPDVIEYM